MSRHVDREIDSRLHIGHQPTSLLLQYMHSSSTAAVCMLNHLSQLKTPLLGSKLSDSDLLLTSNPDKHLPTTFQSAFLLSPILQNEGLHHFSLLICWFSYELKCDSCKTPKHVISNICIIFRHISQCQQF